MPAAVDPVLAFSTLACPEWSPLDVVERAAHMGFGAIEWRGGESGHISSDMPAAAIVRIRNRMQDCGIGALAITTYGTLVSGDEAARAREASALLRSVDLAAELGAEAIRVFVGIPDPGTAAPVVIDRAVDALEGVASHATRAGVAIALEPHDLHARAAALSPILRRVEGLPVGVIWEIGNAWAAGEDPDDSLPVLEPWIRYVQLKDGRGTGDAWQLCALGEGDVPLARALSALAARGPLPPLSIEWERAWDERLEPAEVALPLALGYVRSILAAHDPMAGMQETSA